MTNVTFCFVYPGIGGGLDLETGRRDARMKGNERGKGGGHLNHAGGM